MLGQNSTKIYAVYVNPDDDMPHETAEFVEEHFALWGFVFHAFWCFYHRLWFWGLGMLFIWALFVAGGIEMGLSLITTVIVELAVRLIVGFDGNHWREQALQRKGYILSDIVSGDSELAAKRRFYDHWLETGRAG